MESALVLLDRYGVSLVGIVVMTVFAVRIVRWFAPRVDRVVNVHVAFVDTVGVQVTEQTACMRALADGQEKHGEILAAISERLIEKRG